MCGIVGFCGEAPDQPRILECMQRIVRHRGPDGCAEFITPDVALGLTRLAINDIPHGTRVFHDDSGRIAVIANGEIYSASELRSRLEADGQRFRTNCDTEVVPYLYARHGVDAISKLEGMFAIAIWDARSRTLLLARDRYGIKPLFYYSCQGICVFASEIKALFYHPSVPKRVEWQAISDYLTLGYIPGEQSAFNGIRKVPPASYVLFRLGGSPRTIRYWDLAFRQKIQNPVREEIRRQVWDHIVRAVKKQLLSDVPVGAFLSGGLDSSALVAAMAELGVSPLRTFSIGFSAPGFDERKDAALVARYFGAEHQELEFTPQDLLDTMDRHIWHLDEPLADVSSLPLFCLSRLARKSVSVVLSGEGGDEIFAGYETYRVRKWVDMYQRLPGFLRRSVIEPAIACLPASEGRLAFEFKAKRFVSGAFLPLLHAHLHWRHVFDEEAKAKLLRFQANERLRSTAELVAQVTSTVRDEPELNQLLYLDSRLYLPDDLLVKADRMSMAASLEIRVPMTDTELVEYVSSLPVSCKLAARETKPLLRGVLRGRVPAAISNKKKIGFTVPIARWLRGPLRELLQDTTQPPSIREMDLLDPGAVRKLVDEHLTGRANHWWPLWTIMVLVTWHRQHFSRPDRIMSCAVSRA